MNKRLLIWFSCGVASAVATKLAIAKYKDTHKIIIARCIVKEEHEDNDRFADDCEKWFGMPILNLINSDYEGSIYKVFEKRKYISGIGGAPCTMLLKKQVRLDFQLPSDAHIFGYCAEEQDRFDNFLDANNIEAYTPVIDSNLSHTDCLAIIRDAGIELPTMYKLGYKHNNCIGCVKATGQGYWNKIKQDFPVQFERMAKFSRKLGVRLIRDKGVRIYLDEIVEGAGNYQQEPEIQCGIFCEMAKETINYVATQRQDNEANEQK
jgi:hypothetical protein